jgi:hypothetical protein
MKNILQALILSVCFFCVPTTVHSATIALSTDTVMQKERLRLRTDPTYKPANQTVKGFFKLGLFSILAGFGIIAFFALTSTVIESLGAAILIALFIISLIYGGLLLLLIGGVIWLERFMESVNRRRKKDGQPKVNWFIIRAIEVALAVIWFARSNPRIN